jgi:hypothetical protein
MILAVLREAACCRVEVATIERLIESFGDAPIGIGNIQGRPSYGGLGCADFTLHTNPNAATNTLLTVQRYPGSQNDDIYECQYGRDNDPDIIAAKGDVCPPRFRSSRYVVLQP